MASLLEQRRKSLNRIYKSRGGTGISNKSSSTSSSVFDPKKQIENYTTRLENIGQSKEDATDNRNWLEKTLNLKKDQNVLFDIFELINRPQQALFGGIASAQEDGDFWEGAKEGITGEKETSGGELLRNAGMSGSGEFNLFDKDTWKEASPSDFLGFALDIFADPMDIPLVPVSAATKGAKAVDTAADAAKSIGTAADVAQQGKRLASANEMLFRGAGKALKGTGKLADKGLEKVLGKIDNTQINRVNKLAQQTGQTADDIFRKVGKSDLLGDYQALKKGIRGSIDNNKVLGGLTGQARRSANSVETADALANARLNQLEALTKNTANKVGMDSNELSRHLTNIIESEQDTTIDGVNWLNKLGKDSNTFEGTEESVAQIKELIEDKAPSIKFKQSSTPTKLVIDTKKSKFLTDFKNNKEVREAISKMNLEKSLGYTDEQLKYLDDTRKLFADNKELTKLLNEHRKAYGDVANLYKDYAGVDLDFARKKGYVRRAQGDLQKEASDALKSDITGNIRGKGLVNEKAFGSREYDVGLVANREKEAARQAQLAGEIGEDGETSLGKIQKQIQSKEKKLYANRKAELEGAKQSITESLEKAKSFDINVTKAGKKEGQIRESIANNRNNLVQTQERLNKSTIKRLEDIKDNALTNRFSKHSQQVSEYTKEYNNIIERMSVKDIPEAEMRKLTSQSTKLEKKIQDLNLRMDADLARVNGYVDKKTLTQIAQTNNALKKAESLGGKGNKLTEELNKNLANQNLLKQSNQATIDGLEKRLKDINLQLGALDPARDADTLKEIEKLQNKLSILQSNEGKELFNLNFHAGMRDFIDTATQYSKGAKVYNDAVLYGTFKNPDYVKILEEGAEVPRGFVKVDGSTLQKQFESVKNLLPDTSDTLQELGKEWADKKLLLDRDLANLINVGRQSKEQANALVKVIDGFNNMFKKYKILTPGFQMRNIAGNATNMVLSGVPAGKIPEYYAKAGMLLNDSKGLLDKVASGAKLTAKEADNWKILQQFYEGGFQKAGTKLQDLEHLREIVSNKKGPLNKLAKINANMNEKMDMVNRLSLLMYANDNPKYIQKLGKSNAIEAVKYALMDPSNMSDFERNVMKRIVPFYTFTKQNLLFQATNMMKNTPKYNRLIKTINKTYGSLSDNEYNQYQKEAMQIPIGKDGNGNTIFLKTNLPLSDLGEWMSDPLRRSLSSTSPLIKTPVEMVTGQNIFSGQDAYYNTGNDLYKSITGKDMSTKGKDWAGKAEQLLAGLGVDTISTNLVKKVAAGMKAYNGDMDSQAMWAEIFRSILQNTNQDKIDQSRAYEEMEQLQQYIKGLKNQGIDVPTIREINAANKSKLNRAKRRRNSVFAR